MGTYLNRGRPNFAVLAQNHEEVQPQARERRGVDVIRNERGIARLDERVGLIPVRPIFDGAVEIGAEQLDCTLQTVEPLVSGADLVLLQLALGEPAGGVVLNDGEHQEAERHGHGNREPQTLLPGKPGKAREQLHRDHSQIDAPL